MKRPKARSWDGRDHTAPWHCSAEVCALCEGKPSYGTWWYATQVELLRHEGEREERRWHARRRRDRGS